MFLAVGFPGKDVKISSPKILSVVLDSAKSLAIKRLDIFACLGLPCFSATHFRVKFSSSKSVHLHCHNSPILKPVSFSPSTRVPTFLLQPATNTSTSFFSGTKGKEIFVSLSYYLDWLSSNRLMVCLLRIAQFPSKHLSLIMACPRRRVINLSRNLFLRYYNRFIFGEPSPNTKVSFAIVIYLESLLQTKLWLIWKDLAMLAET